MKILICFVMRVCDGCHFVKSETNRWIGCWSDLDHVHAPSAGLSHMFESASRTVIAITDLSATSASNSYKKGACQSEVQPNRG